MKLTIPSFWRETRELDDILDVGEWTVTTTGAALGLAIALGVANPAALGIAVASLAFGSPVRKAIEVAAKRINKKLTLEEVVAIAVPLAYVKSFNYWIERNSILKAKIQQKRDYSNEVNNSISNFTLDRELAINAVRILHKSELGQTINEVLSSQLKEYEMESVEAHIIVTWIAWKARVYLKEAIEEIKSCQYVQIDDVNLLNVYKISGEHDQGNRT